MTDGVPAAAPGHAEPLNKLYIRFARIARGSGAQRSDAPIALSVKPELPVYGTYQRHSYPSPIYSYLWPEGVKPAISMPESCAPRGFLMVAAVG